MAVGGFAFLLRYLTWPQAALMALTAFLFNWQVLPRIGGRALWRGSEQERGYARGILLYPLAVLGLVLFFHSDEELWMVAAVWGVLAFGDGMASLLGQAFGGTRLPWNRDKSWAGFLAFVVFGTLGAGVLAAWTLHLPFRSLLDVRVLGVVLPLALLCALAESVPTTLDDNLTVPLVGGVFIALVAPVEWRSLLQEPDLPSRLWTGLGLNAAIAAGPSSRSPSTWRGPLPRWASGRRCGRPRAARSRADDPFFVVGSAVTNGLPGQGGAGIAQRGGARGWRNAWANRRARSWRCWQACLAQGRSSVFGMWDLGTVVTLAYAASVATRPPTRALGGGKATAGAFLITSLKPVPPGTEGAVSLEGSLGGLAGGAIVASVGAMSGLYAWPAAALVAIAGLLGSLAESVIGTVAEKRGWLDNDLLNALNTAIGAAIAVAMVRLM
jgi:uncharacterized protein (TIGR00297 family)